MNAPQTLKWNMTSRSKIKVPVTPKEPEENLATEEIAKAVIEIARGCRILLNGRLKREAVVALIHDKSKINKGIIEIVLNNLERLEDTWIKKPNLR